eukprot:9474104-Pyramimonas_sp.AAC.1
MGLTRVGDGSGHPAHHRQGRLVLGPVFRPLARAIGLNPKEECREVESIRIQGHVGDKLLQIPAGLRPHDVRAEVLGVLANVLPHFRRAEG